MIPPAHVPDDPDGIVLQDHRWEDDAMAWRPDHGADELRAWGEMLARGEVITLEEFHLGVIAKAPIGQRYTIIDGTHPWGIAEVSEPAPGVRAVHWRRT